MYTIHLTHPGIRIIGQFQYSMQEALWGSSALLKSTSTHSRVTEDNAASIQQKEICWMENI